MKKLLYMCGILTFFCFFMYADNTKKTTQSFFNKIITVQNNEQKSFDVVPISSIEQVNAIPKKIGLDYRVTKQDTKDKISFLKGICLDHEHIRSRVFAIKDGDSIVGVATIIITPKKHFSKEIFLKTYALTSSKI